MATTITLEYPIEYNGQTIDTIELKRPKAGQILDSQNRKGSDADKEFALFASLTGLAPAALRELDIADYLALQEAYKGFLS